MNCYPEIVLRRFAAGELDEPGMKGVLQHAEACPRCRHALAAAERNVEKQLLVLADRKDWFPPHPRKLKARVFSGVADDRNRRARQAGARRRHWRMAPALAAAAVLLLILGARYLGEPRWNGRLEPTQGALLLSPSGESFSVIDRMESLPPGGLVMVPAGCAAILELEGDTRLEMPESALLVIGDPDAGPSISVARGVVRIHETPKNGLLIRSGGREVVVRGTCEFEVHARSPADALASARAWSDQARSGITASILPVAEGSPGASGATFFIRIRSISGSISVPGDRVIATAGQEVTSRDGSGWSASVRSTNNRILSAELLSEQEKRAIPVLLRRDRDAGRSLRSAARDRKLPSWKRGLAIWLLGEIGDSRAVPTLTHLLARKDSTPVMVRAAAVRSLSLLGAVDPVLVALDDAEPAVAETAILTLPPGSGERLRELAEDCTRPDWERALAAHRADERGVKIDIPTLLELLDSLDPNTRALAQQLIERIPDENGDRILLDLARSGTDLERARAIGQLGRQGMPEALSIALAGVQDASAPAMRGASLRLIAVRAPEQLEAFIDGALTAAEPEIRNAILSGLCRIDRYGDAPVANHRDALRRIAISTWSAPMNRAMALSLLNDAHLVRVVLGANPEPELLVGVLQYAASGKIKLDDLTALRSWTVHHQPRVRIRAIIALATVRPAEAVGLIRERLRDGTDDPVLLLPTLGEYTRGDHDEITEELLLGLLHTHPSQTVRIYAASLLGGRARLGRTPVIDALFSIAEDPDESAAVRAATFSALESVPATARLDQVLMDALHSGDEAVAIPAARFLRKRAGPDNQAGMGLAIDIEVLQTVPCERARALIALVCPTRPEDIRGLLRSRDEYAAAVVLNDLPAEDLPMYLEEIRNLTTAAQPLLRVLALCRLPESEGDRAVLSDRLTDPDPLVQLTAAVGLAGRGVSPMPDGALHWLRQSIRRYKLATLRGIGTDLADGMPRRDLRPIIEEAVAFRIDSTLDRAGRRNRLLGFAETRETVRRKLSREARQIIHGNDAGLPERVAAVSTLAWAGERADVITLLTLANGMSNGMSALRDTCRVSVEALLGRPNAGSVEGEGMDALNSWWEQRSYALEVPSQMGR